MEQLQEQFEVLMKQMEQQFEMKIATINKRYHVIENALKTRIKQLETQKHTAKRDDLECIKLKAKIFSLEKQVEMYKQIENAHNSIQQPQQESDRNGIQQMLLNLLESIQCSLNIPTLSAMLFPQVDNVLPNLIEILPIQCPLLADLTLVLYKNKYYGVNESNTSERQHYMSWEQHVNEVMFSSGTTKAFEISFTPRTDLWKKKSKLKDSIKDCSNLQCLLLTQSNRVQEHIIKIMKNSLEETFFKLEREEFKQTQNGRIIKDNPRHILIQRINCVLMILMLSDNYLDIILALKNLTFDLQLSSQALTKLCVSYIVNKDIFKLLTNRLTDYKHEIELILAALQLMKQLKQHITIIDVLEQLNGIVQHYKQADIIEMYNELCI